VALAKAARDREHLADGPHHEVPVGVDVLLDAAQDPVRQEQQCGTEDVDDEGELLDQCRPAEDRQAAQHERGDDAPEEHARSILHRDAEVGEQQDEDEQVVERERALDQVHGRVDHGVVAAAEEPHQRRHRQAEDQPPDRPDRPLAEARLAPAGKEAEVDEEEDEDRHHQRGPRRQGDEVHRRQG
jgi:hypothetical protein